MALLLPTVAEAKITCEEPQRPARQAPLRGLPDTPVAGREYRLTAVLRPDAGVNPAPHLAAQHCGPLAPHEVAAGAGGGFQRRGRGVYTLVLRFDRPGPWALSLMDRHGRFHELGFRQVRAAEPRLERRQGHDGAGDPAKPLRERRPKLRDRRVAALTGFVLEQVLWIFHPGAVHRLAERLGHLML
jgi:hypothetical protein